MERVRRRDRAVRRRGRRQWPVAAADCDPGGAAGRPAGGTGRPGGRCPEHLGGYFIIDVADLSAAIEWAARSPNAAAGCTEVRPVLPPVA
ncbi:MAG: YciI family protein [bacterium]